MVTNQRVFGGCNFAQSPCRFCYEGFCVGGCVKADGPVGFLVIDFGTQYINKKK